MEQLGFEIYLTVRYRNNVCRDIRRNVAAHRFDDRKCGNASSAVFIIETRRTLEQAAVEIEYISGVCLTSRRSVKKKGHCTVSDRMLR